MNWLDSFSMFRTPELSNALVDWAKTQPGYEGWDGTPVAPTLEQDRGLLSDLYVNPNMIASTAPGATAALPGVNPADWNNYQSLQNNLYQGYSDTVGNNPTMGGDQLFPELQYQFGQQYPAIEQAGDTVRNQYGAWQDKQLEPSGFWKGLDTAVRAGAGMATSAALGGLGGGSLAGSVLGPAGDAASAISGGGTYLGDNSGSDGSTRSRAPFVPAPKPPPMVAAAPTAASPVPGSRQPFPVRTVSSMYHDVLGRAPESQEVQDYWGQKFGSDIDQSEYDQFQQAASPELAARQPAPAPAPPTNQPSALNVAQMYRDVLGREPESQQVVDYWTQQFGPTFGEEDKTAFTQAASPELAQRQAAALRGQTPTATPQPNGMPAPIVM